MYRIKNQASLKDLRNKTEETTYKAQEPKRELVEDKEAKEPAYETPVADEGPAPEGNVEIIEMDRMRKLIARYMVESKQTSAHVTSFAEADVTSMVIWRDRIKSEFEKRENTKITFTP